MWHLRGRLWGRGGVKEAVGVFSSSPSWRTRQACWGHLVPARSPEFKSKLQQQFREDPELEHDVAWIKEPTPRPEQR